jgi:antitoxin (DNA-binding transcriptional repressor) of toxin-antitoxin stability system
MRITVSKLRKNLYSVLDEVIKRGVPVEIVPKGTVLRIVPEPRASKLAGLKRRTGFVGDPDDIIGMHWLEQSGSPYET